MKVLQTNLNKLSTKIDLYGLIEKKAEIKKKNKKKSNKSKFHAY